MGTLRSVKLLALFLVLAAGCSSVSRGPAQVGTRVGAQVYTSDEPLVSAAVTLPMIDRELKRITTTSTILKSLEPVRLDPQTRIATIKGVIHYPMTRLFKFASEPGKAPPTDHPFEIAVSFPTARELSQVSYFTLRFHRLVINGDDYINAFGIGAALIQTILANSELVDYVFRQVEGRLSNPDRITRLREVIADNGLVVNEATRSISLKLNLSYFQKLAEYAETGGIQDLRLWYFGPDLLSGTRDLGVFRLVAGLGKPGDNWLRQNLAESERDGATLEQVKKELYVRYGDARAVSLQIEDYLKSITPLRPEGLDPRYRRQWEEFVSQLKSEASERLAASNELFRADPEGEHVAFLGEQQARARTFATNLDRELTIDRLALEKSEALGEDVPILTEGLSQDALNASLNFIGNLQRESREPRFELRDAAIALAPQIPGVILRGTLNVDINQLLGQLSSGFIGKEFNLPIREAREGVRFEMAVGLRMANDGLLGLDPRSIRLLEGDHQVRLDRSSANQRLFLDLVKLHLVQAIAGTPSGVTVRGGVVLPGLTRTRQFPPDAEQHERESRERLAYLESLKARYAAEGGSFSANMLVDVEGNPQSASGPELLARQDQVLMSDLLRYDEQDQLIKIFLDPRLVADTLFGVRNRLQVWNVEPRFSKGLNRNFLEFAVGDGRRGRRYVTGLQDASQDPEQARFAATYRDWDSSQVDLVGSVQFDALEQSVNQTLQEILIQRNAELERQLEEARAQTHYRLDNLRIEIRDLERIRLRLKASVITKSGTWFSWFRRNKWKVSEDSYALVVDLTLNERRLSQLRGDLKPDALPIYYQDKAIGITPHRVAIEFGKPSLINSALSALTRLNLDAPILNKVRSLLLGMVTDYFNELHQPRSGKPGLRGKCTENFAKVLATQEELLLSLNPRLAGPAMELGLLGEDHFIDRSIKVDTRNSRLHYAMGAAFGVARADKRRLSDLVVDIRDAAAPLLANVDPAELARTLNTGLFADRWVRASDPGAMSFYHRLLGIARRYGAILDLLPGAEVASGRSITVPGAELLYFAGAALEIEQQLGALLSRLEQGGQLQRVDHAEELSRIREELREKWVRPLLSRYRDRHHPINAAVVAAPPSYWTSHFVPDALFAEAAYGELMQRAGRP